MPFGLIAGLAAGAGLGAGQSALNYAFNRRLQKHQHEFQERMSSTAYQRARKDLEAAQLNPMLAFTRGGGAASTPSGGTPSVGRGESWATTGKNLRSQNAQLRMLNAQAKAAEHAADSAQSKAIADRFMPATAAFTQNLTQQNWKNAQANQALIEQNATSAKGVADLWRGDYTSLGMAAREMGMSPADIVRLIRIGGSVRWRGAGGRGRVIGGGSAGPSPYRSR